MSRFAVLFCIFLFAGNAAAQVQSLGEVSFAVPEGWDYSVEASGDHSNLSIIQNGQVVALAVFRASDAFGALSASRVGRITVGAGAEDEVRHAAEIDTSSLVAVLDGDRVVRA